MGFNANATLMGGPGGGISASDLDTLCESFEAAVNNFCTQENIDSRKKGSATKDMYDRRGKFNDFFYRSVAKRDKGLAGKMIREHSGVFRRGSGQYLGTVGQVARGRGAGGAVVSATERASARYMNGVMRRSSAFGRTGANRFLNKGLDGMRGATVGAFKNGGAVTSAMQNSVYTRWQDGRVKGSWRAVEIKGPKDTPRPGQIPDAQKAGMGQPPLVISCESCTITPDCSNGCP